MFVSWKCSGRHMEGQERIRVWPEEMRVNLALSMMAQSCSGPVFPQSYLQPRPWSNARGHVCARQASRGWCQWNHSRDLREEASFIRIMSRARKSLRFLYSSDPQIPGYFLPHLTTE